MILGKKILRDELIKEREHRYNRLELVTGEYLHNPEHPATAFINANMMECDKSCAEILNISSGIFNKIVTGYQDAVGPMMCEYEIHQREIIKHLTANGVVGIEKYKEDNEDKFEIVPSDEVFYVNSTPLRVIEFEIYDEEKDEYNYYLMKRKYFVGETKTELYQMQSKKSVHGKQVSIAEIDTETELGRIMLGRDAEVQTGYDVQALNIIELDSCPFDIVSSLVFAIERKIVSADNQVIQFIKQKLLLKGFGKMSNEELDDPVWFQGVDASAEYLAKSNPYVLEAWDIIEKELKLISALTGFPLDDFGFEVSSSLGIDAQKARRVTLDKRVEGFRNMCEYAMYQFEGKEFIIKWNASNHTDRTTLLEEFKLAQEIGVMSKLDMIKELFDLDEDGAREKLLEINGESVIIEEE